MRKIANRLSGVVWTALFALVGSFAAFASALLGASLEVILGLGIYSLVMAILTPKD
jgi:hypothetical protein